MLFEFSEPEERTLADEVQLPRVCISQDRLGGTGGQIKVRGLFQYRLLPHPCCTQCSPESGDGDIKASSILECHRLKYIAAKVGSGRAVPSRDKAK